MKILRNLFVGLTAALFGLSANAQNQITATVTITNQPLGTGETFILASTGYTAFTFTPTNTVSANAYTNFLIGASINPTVANLFSCITTNVSLASSTYNQYTTPTVFTLTFPIGTPAAITFGGNWATVVLSTNTYTYASGVITNSGATITAPFTLVTSTAATNYINLPTVAWLVANGYRPGATFRFRKVDTGVKSWWPTVPTGMSLIPSVMIGVWGGTNSYQLATPVAYGTWLGSEIITNNYTAHYTWDGGTNWVSE